MQHIPGFTSLIAILLLLMASLNCFSESVAQSFSNPLVIQSLELVLRVSPVQVLNKDIPTNSNPPVLKVVVVDRLKGFVSKDSAMLVWEPEALSLDFGGKEADDLYKEHASARLVPPKLGSDLIVGGNYADDTIRINEKNSMPYSHDFEGFVRAIGKKETKIVFDEFLNLSVKKIDGFKADKFKGYIFKYPIYSVRYQNPDSKDDCYILISFISPKTDKYLVLVVERTGAKDSLKEAALSDDISGEDVVRKYGWFPKLK